MISTLGKLSHQNPVDVLHQKRHQGKGKVAWDGCTPVNQCIFVLQNNIFIQKSDQMLKVGCYQWLREIFFMITITEQVISWILLIFMGATMH